MTSAGGAPASCSRISASAARCCSSNAPDDLDQQPLARAEVVDQHPVTGAERSGHRAQADLADAVLGHVRDRPGKQPPARARPARRLAHRASLALACTARYMYHAVHHAASASNTPPPPPPTRPPCTRSCATAPLARLGQARLVRARTPRRGRAEGLGAVRIFRQGKVEGRDTVAELVENRRFSYTHQSSCRSRTTAPTSTSPRARAAPRSAGCRSSTRSSQERARSSAAGWTSSSPRTSTASRTTPRATDATAGEETPPPWSSPAGAALGVCCGRGAPSPRSGARKLAPERSGRTRRAPPPDPRAATPAYTTLVDLPGWRCLPDNRPGHLLHERTRSSPSVPSSASGLPPRGGRDRLNDRCSRPPGPPSHWSDPRYDQLRPHVRIERRSSIAITRKEQSSARAMTWSWPVSSPMQLRTSRRCLDLA